MESSSGYEDPLGFTKQTAIMLVGLGAGDLIQQFKKRNISTQALAELKKEDLIVLGADENLADDMLRQLRSAARKYSGRNLSDELKTNELIKIFVGANQQLNLVETFLAYARLRLAERNDDFIVNTRKNTRASQALCVATTYTIAEIEELERNFQKLAAEIEGKNRGTMKKSSLYGLMTGIGLTAGLLCTLRYALLTVGRS